MFEYPRTLTESKTELYQLLDQLEKEGYNVVTESFILDKKYTIDKFIIQKSTRVLDRVVLTSGLHGIEGYIGHVCQLHFLKNIIQDINDTTQIIIYHILNPYGMDLYRRVNQNNIDLNRNYSKNQFSSKNSDFLKVHKFLNPRKFHSVILMNLWFYLGVVYNIIKYSLTSMNLAILKGQKIDNNSIYYSGTSFQKSTDYILNELDKLYQSVDKVVWLDIHSGYGKKYQLSIINSRFEKEITTALKEQLHYEDIIGFESDTMYDTDGDITEKLYQVHHQRSYHSDLLALCMEFGTIGNTIFSRLHSFKAILFENGLHHYPSTKYVDKYVRHLMKRTFLPNSQKWKTNAIQKFDQATREILQYKKLISL